MPGLGGNAWEASFSRVLTVSTEHSLPLITASLRWDPDVHTVNRPLHGKDKRRINRYVYLSVEKNCMQTERDVLSERHTGDLGGVASAADRHERCDGVDTPSLPTPAHRRPAKRFPRLQRTQPC